MDDFRFESGSYLYLLALVPVMMAFSSYLRRFVEAKLLRFAQRESLTRLIHGRDSDLGTLLRRIFYYLAFCLFVLALARPQANPVFEERASSSLDIMILLDVSRSMDAEDMYPSRLKKAKRSISTLLDKLSGDRVGITAFAGSAVLICPLTSDYEIVRTFLQAIDTSTIQNQGTNIQAALETAVKAFERGSQTESRKEAPSHIVVLMSDGEETENINSLEAAKAATKAGIVVHTIAFGSEKGVPIPLRNEQGVLQGYKRDEKGNSVITTVKPNSLRSIAGAGGGTFYFSTLDEEEIRDILLKATNMQRTSQKEVKAKIYQEYFMYPLLAGILALLLSFAPNFKHLLRSTRFKQASLLFLLLCFSSSAFASSVTSFLWNKEKKATESAKNAFDQEKYGEAADMLKELQANDPQSGIISYNLGTSYIKDKKFEEGRKALTEAATKPESNSLARFNIAGSYAEEKNTQTAREEYASLVHDLATKQNLNENEQQILALAKKNLEHLSDKQQQNQKQSGGKQNEQNKDDKKDQKQNQDKQDNKDGENQQNKKNDDKNKESEKDQDKQKPKEYDLKKKKGEFQERKDLSENDAKRLLESLQQQEGQLQKKFLRNKENKTEKNESGKDW